MAAEGAALPNDSASAAIVGTPSHDDRDTGDRRLKGHDVTRDDGGQPPAPPPLAAADEYPSVPRAFEVALDGESLVRRTHSEDDLKLFEWVPNPVWVHDVIDWTCVYVNRMAAKFWGVEHDAGELPDFSFTPEPMRLAARATIRGFVDGSTRSYLERVVVLPIGGVPHRVLLRPLPISVKLSSWPEARVCSLLNATHVSVVAPEGSPPPPMPPGGSGGVSGPPVPPSGAPERSTVAATASEPSERSTRMHSRNTGGGDTSSTSSSRGGDPPPRPSSGATRSGPVDTLRESSTASDLRGTPTSRTTASVAPPAHGDSRGSESGGGWDASTTHASASTKTGLSSWAAGNGRAVRGARLGDLVSADTALAYTDTRFWMYDPLIERRNASRRARDRDIRSSSGGGGVATPRSVGADDTSGVGGVETRTERNRHADDLDRGESSVWSNESAWTYTTYSTRASTLGAAVGIGWHWATGEVVELPSDGHRGGGGGVGASERKTVEGERRGAKPRAVRSAAIGTHVLARRGPVSHEDAMEANAQLVDLCLDPRVTVGRLLMDVVLYYERPVPSATAPDIDIGGARAMARAASAVAAAVDFEAALGAPPADPTWIRVRVRKILDVKHQSPALLVQEDDVSQEHRLQEKLVEAMDVIQEKQKFVSVYTHSLRTPLNGVMGMLQCLRDTQLNNLQRDFVDTAIFSSQALLSTLQDVLDLRRAEASFVEVARAPVPVSRVADMCEECAVMFGATCEESGLRIDVDYSPRLLHQHARIVCDVERLRQITINLVSNAVKFTRRGGVRISLRAVWSAPVYHDISCPAGRALRRAIDGTTATPHYKHEVDEAAVAAANVRERFQADVALHSAMQRRHAAGAGAAASDATDCTCAGSAVTMISVADSGRGIKPEHREAVFEQYFTVDGSASSTRLGSLRSAGARPQPAAVASSGETMFGNSAGVGLSAVKALCRAIGASVHLESEVDVGSTFTIAFATPLATSDSADGSDVPRGVPYWLSTGSHVERPVSPSAHLSDGSASGPAGIGLGAAIPSEADDATVAATSLHALRSTFGPDKATTLSVVAHGPATAADSKGRQGDLPGGDEQTTQTGTFGAAAMVSPAVKPLRGLWVLVVQPLDEDGGLFLGSLASFGATVVRVADTGAAVAALETRRDARRAERRRGAPSSGAGSTHHRGARSHGRAADGRDIVLVRVPRLRSEHASASLAGAMPDVSPSRTGTTQASPYRRRRRAGSWGGVMASHWEEVVRPTCERVSVFSTAPALDAQPAGGDHAPSTSPSPPLHAFGGSVTVGVGGDGAGRERRTARPGRDRAGLGSALGPVPLEERDGGGGGTPSRVDTAGGRRTPRAGTMAEGARTPRVGRSAASPGHGRSGSDAGPLAAPPGTAPSSSLWSCLGACLPTRRRHHRRRHRADQERAVARAAGFDAIVSPTRGDLVLARDAVVTGASRVPVSPDSETRGGDVDVDGSDRWSEKTPTGPGVARGDNPRRAARRRSRGRMIAAASDADHFDLTVVVEAPLGSFLTLTSDQSWYDYCVSLPLLPSRLFTLLATLAHRHTNAGGGGGGDVWSHSRDASQRSTGSWGALGARAARIGAHGASDKNLSDLSHGSVNGSKSSTDSAFHDNAARSRAEEAWDGIAATSRADSFVDSVRRTVTPPHRSEGILRDWSGTSLGSSGRRVGASDSEAGAPSDEDTLAENAKSGATAMRGAVGGAAATRPGRDHHAPPGAAPGDREAAADGGGGDSSDAVDVAALVVKTAAALSAPRAAVLIVDDSRINLKVAHRMLHAAVVRDTRLVLAHDGREAVELFQNAGPGGFALVLMDLSMPVLDGLGATVRIRAIESEWHREAISSRGHNAGAARSLRPAAIVALTAHSSSPAKTREKCLAVGMSDAAFKPVSTESLVQVVRNWAPQLLR